MQYYKHELEQYPGYPLSLLTVDADFGLEYNTRMINEVFQNDSRNGTRMINEVFQNDS